MVNDYRRGRAGAVSHTVSQSMVENLAKKRGKREEEEGRPVYLVSPLGNYRLSRRPKSQRLNKEMKRNLRKMDEPPGKHPLFIPLVLQMITNALPLSLSLSLSLCARCEEGEGGVAKERERKREREREVDR